MHEISQDRGSKMNCSKCGKNLALVGRMHNCVVANTVANTVANNRGLEKQLSRLPHKQEIAGAEPAPATTSRHGKYADADKRKAYMRDYMARRRADQKSVAN
jgi:hypothetical protein